MCKYLITTEGYDGIDYDCELELTLDCEDCPFGWYEYNSLLLWIEKGKAHYWDYTGNWADENLINHITNAFNDYVLPVLEMDEKADLAIKDTKHTDNQYTIIMINVKVISIDDDITLEYDDLHIQEDL